MFRSLLGLLVLALTPSTSACFTKRDSSTEDWSYDTPTHWADDNASYGSCRNGTHQSPIALSTHDISSSPHRPSFDYTGNWRGTLTNNGHGLKFDLEHKEGDFTTLPKLHFDGQTLYLSTWHTHSPGEHAIDGDKSEAEMHFVHVDRSGKVRAVVGFRLDPFFGPGDAKKSAFFEQLGNFPAHRDHAGVKIASFKPSLALSQVNNLKKYWTYSGSLTTPPCTEGVRWFVAAETFVLGDGQLQELLSVSHYSSRPVQHIWRHDVGL